MKIITLHTAKKRQGKQLLFVLLCMVYPVFTVFSQAKWMEGKVLDESGTPYFGATIFVNKGESTTFSDNKGHFSIPVPEETFVLTAKALGYRIIELRLKPDSLYQPLSLQFVPDAQELETLEIHWSQILEKKEQSPLSINYLHRDVFMEIPAENLGATLRRLPGVQSLTAGTSLSRPMIRGLSANRVVFASNGIKQQGQFWSNHHGISVDQHAVHTIEVLKGPASLAYGTDAIGGVINLLPHPVPDGWEGNLGLSARSNTAWFGASGGIAYGQNGFFGRMNASYNLFGDFHIPQTQDYLLPAPLSTEEASHKVPLGKQVYNTAGREMGVQVSFGKLGARGKSWFDVSYHNQYTGFFDWQGLVSDSLRSIHEQKSSDIQLPAQRIENLTIQHFTNRYFGKDKLEFAIGFQSNRTQEFTLLSDLTGNREEELKKYAALDNLALDLHLLAVTLKTSYLLRGWENQMIRLGLEASFNSNDVDGFSHILPTYNTMAIGSFVHYQRMLSEKWAISGGVRFDLHRFAMESTKNPDPGAGQLWLNPDFQSVYPGLAFSLGWIYSMKDQSTLRFNLGKSYRIPSAYELGAYGLHRHEGRFEQGDTANQPEQAWQFDLDVEQKLGFLTLGLTPFLNYFTNYLFLQPTPVLRAEGQVYRYDQTTALLTGAEFSLTGNTQAKLSYETNLEFVYAVNLERKSALPFTPPLQSRTVLKYHFSDRPGWEKAFLGAELVLTAAQRYTVPNELDTPGYYLVNLSAGMHWMVARRPVKIRLHVHNLLNTPYFDHLSFYRRLRLHEPGRDIQLFVEIPFFNHHKY